MKRLLLIPVCIMFVATASMAAPALKDRKSDDRARIIGQWVQEALSQQGGARNTIGTGTFRFSEDGSCGITAGGPGNGEFAAVYSLDPSTTPGRMKWLNGPERTEWDCLYEFDGERLKVAFVDRGTEIPKKIEPASNLTIYYLKRVK